MMEEGGCLEGQQNLDFTKLIFSCSIDDDNKAEKELEQFDNLLNRNNVFFSDDFRRSFAKLTCDGLKKLVLNLLLRLSTGWRPENRNSGLSAEDSSQSLNQLNVEGLYILSTIDIVKDIKYVQVIKVLAGISRSYPLLSFSQNEGDNEVSVNSCGSRNCVKNSKVSESLLLMNFYSFSFEVVCHLLSGREVDLPMKVTDEQMDVILFGKSSFIIGRSGTGKTTVLTIKLFQNEQRLCSDSEGIYEAENSQFRDVEIVDDPENSKPTVLRQLFVTVSPQLCYVVKQHVSQLKSFDDADVTSKFSDLPDTFIDIPGNIYPLVITFHKFLMMLDGTLGNSFFERFHEARGGSVALQSSIRLREVTFDRLINGNYGGDQMNFVYIDEVQDHSMRQISLFKYICQNVEEGFIFAGDTTQTIARGIDFMFQDIRSMFYKEFISTKISRKQEKGRVSEIKQLKQNFRTHTGVLDLAQSVVDIIYCYFLHSIDKLEPETSLISGEAHVLSESCNDENAIVTIFGSSTSGGEIAGFGVEQVIIICENKEELSRPMFDYWKMRGLVQMRKLDDLVAQAMQVLSSPQEWWERGKKLFYENSFIMAALCFEKDGDTNWEKLAEACGLRASADQIRGTDPESYFGYLRKAAGVFESIGKLESAASCYCDLEEYERAEKIFMDKCGKNDAAAECFTLAGCYGEAAEAYAKGDQFSNCLSVYKRGKLFDKGMQYIVNLKEHANVLTLRLVMMLSLICLLVSDKSEALLRLLTVEESIVRLLPKKLVAKLLLSFTLESESLLVAKAFESVKDPLLIGYFRDKIPQIHAPCAIFVDLKRSKQEIMSVLLPRRYTESGQTSSNNVDVGTTPKVSKVKQTGDGAVLENQNVCDNSQDGSNKKGKGSNKGNKSKKSK
nr:UvrD-like helicase, ATP-binding domain, P-loop containing nucleoside triphosphate hydrolase [Tanacetum cinerariifolium]